MSPPSNAWLLSIPNSVKHQDHYHHNQHDVREVDAVQDAGHFHHVSACAGHHVFCQRISDHSSCSSSHSSSSMGEMDSSPHHHHLLLLSSGCQRRQLLRFLLFLLLLLLTSVQKGTASSSSGEDTTASFKGPEFVLEPPSQVDFSNSTGARIGCSASGLPPPQVTWLRADGTDVENVPSLRQVTEDHTLTFFPFRAEEYRQDIHAVVYKCVATNDVGTVVSRDVKVRGVVKQYYEVQVYDEYVIRGNTAVLKCQVPSFVRDYVRVTSWVVDETYITSTNASNSGNRYMVALTGELYIHQVERNDSYKTYRCRTIHQLTNETQASAPAKVIVTDPQSSVPPRVTHSMAFVMAKQKNTLQLPCVAQGYPVPNYRWYKTVDKQLESINFRDGRFHRHGGILTIERIIIKDSGSYVCVVNNSVGEERVEITLAVTSSLSVSIQPQKQMVDAGKPAAFRCSASGHPIGAYSWSKDGRPLEPSENIHLAERYEVRIRQVQRQDIGMYQCFVENDDESVQGTAELMLGDASPAFVDAFESETHQPGTSVSLRCVASGNPPPKVAWMIDGGPLAENRRLSLGNTTRGRGEVSSYVNISKTRVEDGGEYTCIATNSIGRAEHTARLSVYGLPYIRPLSNQTVVAGQTTQMTCRAAGYPIQSITWERDGVPLPANLRQKTFVNGTIIIQEVERLTDEGVYTCIARNSQGQSARRSVWIVVMAPPKIDRFNFPPDLREEMRTRISCIVSDGDLPISITWLKDGQPIPKTLGVQILNNDEFSSSITFRSVSALHNGNYTCVASNAAATVRHTAELLAHVLPRWSVEPKDLEILSGRQAMLNCQAEGFPRPIITWLRSEGGATGDFKPVMDSGNWYRLLDNGSLVIMHVSKESEGHFLCQATNGIGSGLSKVISIRVNVPAYFEIKSSNQTVRKGDDAMLRCEANGDTPIKIMWTRNRERINMELEPSLSLKEHATPRGLASQLIVKKTERKDASSFSCVATNAYGHDETIIDLTVQEPPSVPSGLKVVEVTSRSVQLTWTTTDSGNSPILRYVIQNRNMADGWNSPIMNISSPGPETAFNVESLLPGNTYQMWVVAENALGRSGASEIIEATCSQEVPGGPPVGVEAKAVGSSTIKITWKPPKKELWNGDILGYYVGYKIYDSTENYVYKTVKVTTDFKEEIHLSNLQKFTKYSVVVQAFNRVGSGPDSDEVIAYTLEDVPSEPPQSVQCVTSTSQSIHVTWSPPPPQSQNGVVRGYKVVYSVTDDNIMRDYNIQETSMVQPPTTKTNIHNLEKYTNYSIQVLAFTRMGDGTLSVPVYCRTNEDVPGPPADVKALVMSSDAILVAWRPPARQNGIILKYTLYMRQADKGGGSNQHPTTKHILSSIPNLSFEARGLKENLRNEFWVTASTVIGEGESTRVISEAPKSRVPARIASFPETIASPYKVAVKLPCRAVGNPTPTREWKLLDKKLKEGDRFNVEADGSLIISNVNYTDSGNYSCSVVNAYGSDQAHHVLVVRAPPISPVLTIVQTTKSSITLSWKQGDDGGSRIQGYSLSYKREFGEWEEIEVEPSEDGVTLNNLHCGSRYQVYLNAYNRMGTGQPSNILSVITDGSAPNVPPKEDVLEPNVTSVLLRLDRWPDGGCRVLYFVVYYKIKHGRTWLLVSNNIQPEIHREFFISDLLSGTWYSVQITVHNDAGSTNAEYDFLTLSKFGESLPSDMADEPREESLPFYSDLNLVLPLAASLACLTVAGVGVCLFNRRRKYRGYRHSQNNINLDTTNDVKNKMNEIRNNATETENHLELTYSPTSGKKLEGQGFPDDVAPYATFNLPGCRADHELQAMQLQTFTEKNPNPPPTAANVVGTVTNPTYPAQRVDDLYSKVKKRQYAAPKLMTPSTQQTEDVVEASPDHYAKSEDSYSAQSQYTWNKRNYGSVPSYRRPSIASDYEPSSVESPDTREKVYDYYNHPTLLIQERHQVPDLIYHTTDSSTSNESSPDEQRRPRRMSRGRYSSPRWSYVNNDRINRWGPDMEIPVTETALNYPPGGKYVNGPNSKSPERERGTTTFRNDNKLGNTKYRNYGKAPLEDLEQMAQVPCYHTKSRQQCLDENCPEDNTIRV